MKRDVMAGAEGSASDEAHAARGGSAADAEPAEDTNAESAQRSVRCLSMLLAAQVWHYWLGWAMALGAVLTLVALIVGYLVKVQGPQYPKRTPR